jgi:hypothetical protein
MPITYLDLFEGITKFAALISPTVGPVKVASPTEPFAIRFLSRDGPRLPTSGIYAYLRPNGEAVYLGMSKGLAPPRNVLNRVWKHLGSAGKLIQLGDYEFGYPHHQWASLIHTNSPLHGFFERGEIGVAAVAAEPHRCIRILEAFGIWRLKQVEPECLNRAD